MNTHILKDFRRRFESELKELQRTAAAIKSELRESAEVNSQAHRDELDCAKGEADLNNRVEIYNHAVKRQGQIHAALARIANGAFGICLACDEGIHIRRMEAYPCAALCFDCQSTREDGVTPKSNQLIFSPRWLGSPIPDLEEAA